MISEPVKINFQEENKNICFRPQSPKFKENIRLKPFLTDKIRVEKFLKSKQKEIDLLNKNIKKSKTNIFNSITENTETIEKNTFFSENKFKDKTEDESYLQPIMKFKPRTDLERIFDTINLNYFGKIDKNLVNEQLKSLGLLKVYNKKTPNNNLNEYSLLREKLKVNPETLEYLIREKQILEQGPKTKEIHELIKNMDNIIQVNKEMRSEQRNIGPNFGIYDSKKTNSYKNKRKNLNNFLAKNILKEYQKKTHFKALCTYSLDLEENNYNDKKMERFNSVDNLDYFNGYNTLTYNYQKKFRNKRKYSPTKMAYLKHLIMKKEKEPEIKNPEKDKKMIEEEPNSNKIIRHQNNILINGKFFNKNDLKGISNEILKKCNYITKHFEVENAGNGKLMFTRGMSVNDFSKRYGLPK